MQTAGTTALAERRAALLSLFVGAALMGGKFVAYFLTGSSAVFSDALESIVNVLASGFALYAIIQAAAPADEDHPYGHGKIEFLAAGFEGGMILLAALIIAGRACIALIRGPELAHMELGLVLIGVATVINAALGVYLITVGRTSNSIALEADGRHLTADAISTLIVFLALSAIHFTGWKWLDPIAALLVAAYITFAGSGLIKRAAAGLMDKQDASDNLVIREILDRHIGHPRLPTSICSYHKLRHRHSGRYHWVDFHIAVPAGWTVKHGHEVASRIEYEIEQALGIGDATAHIEPCDDKLCARCPATDKHATAHDDPQPTPVPTPAAS